MSAKTQQIADGLSVLLADTYTLYLKTQNYHWNVKGPMFQNLHTMFEEQYTELASAVDVIAERIRAIGVLAPGSYASFAKLTHIKEGLGTEKAEEMIKQLAGDQQTIVQHAKSLISLVADEGDEASADLLTQRINVHEKRAWMLKSLLE